MQHSGLWGHIYCVITKSSRESACQTTRRHIPQNFQIHDHCGTKNIILVCICSFIHLVVCLTTGPKPLPKRALHIVRSRASSFKWEYPLLSLRSSISFIRLLPCLPITSIPPCIFPSVTRCRRQFRGKMWPIQFAFRLNDKNTSIYLTHCSISHFVMIDSETHSVP